MDEPDLEDIEADYATVHLAQDQIGAPRMVLRVGLLVHFTNLSLPFR